MASTQYDRGSLEFGRVVALTDGVYSVAMTLLVVSIGIPRVPAEGLVDELLSAHGDVLTFLISVAVLGFYWASNHHFVSHLRAIDSVYAGLNVIYLTLVAFLPLPTALLDRYSGELITVVLYVSTLLLLSVMELVLFFRANGQRLFLEAPPARVVRYSVLTVLAPVIVFALAIPVGLLSSPTYALALWLLLIIPLRLLIERRLGPGGSDPYV